MLQIICLCCCLLSLVVGNRRMLWLNLVSHSQTAIFFWLHLHKILLAHTLSAINENLVVEAEVEQNSSLSTQD